MLDEVFSCLTAWLAPILCFTAEEAWWARGGGGEESVHLRLFPEVPEAWRDDALAARWDRVREVRRVVTGAIEVERAEKRLGSSLQAHPRVSVAREELREAIDGLPFADIAITSAISLVDEPSGEGDFTLEDVPGVAVAITPAEGEKCQRCWKILPEVGGSSEVPATCARCTDAVLELRAAGQ